LFETIKRGIIYIRCTSSLVTNKYRQK